MSLELKITWASEDQRDIFSNPTRFNVIRCGRRWGKTKGAFQRLMMRVMECDCQILWVDTTQANIDKYFNEHLHPNLPKELYHWNKQQKVLTFKDMNALVHFGSAERPENLEGFSYHEVFLNEAGIILKGGSGERLWFNTIRPMTIDYSAIVWPIGTPKGIGLFKEMSEWGRSDDPKYKDWRDVHRTTYDNPLILDSEVDKLVEETHQTTVRQEIFADFLETDEGAPVIPYDIAKRALERQNPVNEAYSIIWGVDPSQGGDDEAGLCKRQGNTLLEPTKGKSGFSSSEGASQGADWIFREYQDTDEDMRPDIIVVDNIGWGNGWYDNLRRMIGGSVVRPCNVAERSHDQTKYFAKRDGLWFLGGKWIETGSLVGDRKIFNELIKPLIDQDFLGKTGKLKVESKEKMKKRMKKDGSSPNRADAFLVTFDTGMELKRRKTIKRQPWREENTTWQSA